MIEEEELLERANEEREQIFLRYDRGRKHAEIDSWEDPAFEIYTQSDRYGFLNPDKSLLNKYEADKEKEMERVKKWLKMLKNWNTMETNERLQRRVAKGIPDRLRSSVWKKLLNLDEIIAKNENVYKRMLGLARKFSPDIRQIDFDVNRQFRNHLFYIERYNVKQRSLFNVLAAYSMYNMEVGYCQGMSTVAGVLLMYLDEEDTFWALNVLLSDKKFAMHGLYIEGFPKLMRFLQHHDKILKKCLPKVKKHLDKHGVDAVLYSLKWFFVIFIERIPFSLCLRVWDIYLLHGERVLTATAFTILKLNKNKILKFKDMDQITEFLQTKLHQNFGYEDDVVIKTLQLSMDELRRLHLEKLPPPSANEYPKNPHGQFIEPSLESKIGHRNTIFSETEKELNENLVYRNELKNDEQPENELKDYEDILEDTISQMNTVSDYDDGSIARHSITGTSMTSTYDISVTSSDKVGYLYRGEDKTEQIGDEDDDSIDEKTLSS